MASTLSRMGSSRRSSMSGGRAPSARGAAQPPAPSSELGEEHVETLAELSQRMNDSMVEAGRTKIGMAAHQGNIRQVESLVFEGASTNQPDEYGETPLHLAAAAGHMEMVRFLVEECRAEINASNWEGWTPLFWSTVRGQVDVSKYLITMGADIMLGTAQDWMPLHYAALNGDVEMCDILLSSGADATAANAFGSTPESLAVNKDVAALIEEGIKKQCAHKTKSGHKQRP